MRRSTRAAARRAPPAAVPRRPPQRPGASLRRLRPYARECAPDERNGERRGQPRSVTAGLWPGLSPFLPEGLQRRQTRFPSFQRSEDVAPEARPQAAAPGLRAGRRLQLPACRGGGGGGGWHADSISQPAPGLGQDVPAPIRAGALRPEPIVSRSRGGSGRLLPGAPESLEPPALRRLPADLPTRPPSQPCRPGNSPTVAAGPGLALSSLLPTRAGAAAAAAAGAAETITGGGSRGGAES
ncbi:hypothetical protein VULLAG_LOCUS7196 [Vulpes lagopus]